MPYSVSYALPQALRVGGREWVIETDFRAVLTVLEAFDDPDLTDDEKAYVCLHNLYRDFEKMPRADYAEAYAAAIDFIDCGSGEKRGGRVMDWVQDAPILFPAVNRVAGFEVRSVPYLHWWTFLGCFMEIREGTFATVLALRQKRNRGKKLEPDELEFWRGNSDICKLRPRQSEAERAEREKLEGILGR